MYQSPWQFAHKATQNVSLSGVDEKIRITANSTYLPLISTSINLGSIAILLC